MADYLGADCFAVCVLSRSENPAEAAAAIDKHLNFARNSY